MSAALATRAGPKKKAMARPKALEVRAMAVAIVRSLWGNHVWWWKGGRGGGGKEGHICISSSATNLVLLQSALVVLAQTHIAPSSGTRKQMKSGEKKSRDEYKSTNTIKR